LLCAFLVSLLPFFVLPLTSTTPNTSPNSTFFFVSYYHFLLLIIHFIIPNLIHFIIHFFVNFFWYVLICYDRVRISTICIMQCSCQLSWVKSNNMILVVAIYMDWINLVLIMMDELKHLKQTV
jgi:hypothetical protein